MSGLGTLSGNCIVRAFQCRQLRGWLDRSSDIERQSLEQQARVVIAHRRPRLDSPPLLGKERMVDDLDANSALGQTVSLTSDVDTPAVFEEIRFELDSQDERRRSIQCEVRGSCEAVGDPEPCPQRRQRRRRLIQREEGGETPFPAPALPLLLPPATAPPAFCHGPPPCSRSCSSNLLPSPCCCGFLSLLFWNLSLTDCLRQAPSSKPPVFQWKHDRDDDEEEEQEQRRKEAEKPPERVCSLREGGFGSN
eukprot:144053-Hanusia_phi.AAC.12